MANRDRPIEREATPASCPINQRFTIPYEGTHALSENFPFLGDQKRPILMVTIRTQKKQAPRVT